MARDDRARHSFGMTTMPPRPILKVAVISWLMLAPVAFFSAVGMYHLWSTGWVLYSSIGTVLSFILGYWLARRWTGQARDVLVLPSPEVVVPTPMLWTDRDKQAWEVVKEHIRTTPPPSKDSLADYPRFAAEAQALALKVARVYVPDTNDPFAHLTLPELLACSQLVTEDLSELVDRYVLGAHHVTIGRFRQMMKASDWVSRWYPKLRDWYYIGSAVLNPAQAAAQAIATKGVMGSLFKDIQGNVLAWFHATATRELGRYLIELNSGRLRVGAKRYREMQLSASVGVSASEKTEDRIGANSDLPTDTGLGTLQLAILGPVKAGKSSLSNLLLGEQKAATDVVPLTAGATEYRFHAEGMPALTLIDTAGFGQDGANDADLAAALQVAVGTDVLILATPANHAARKPEIDFLDAIRAEFAKKPHLKLPQIVVALTKADLLSPKAEWAPPYEWINGTRPKELNIRDSVTAAIEAFGSRVARVIPVVSAEGREFGRDSLLTAISVELDSARGGALLRMLHAEADAKGTLGAEWERGKELLKSAWGAIQEGIRKRSEDK